jgi:glycosyltransferase involved in cell wall biosynthesis
MTPACSIIMPAFNTEDYICEAIDSALVQQCDFGFEIIVVDDGSTDRTADVLRQYADKVRLIRKTHGGPGSARNVGVREARAEIIVFLDADDRMLPQRLAHQVGYMQCHAEVAMTFGATQCQGSGTWCIDADSRTTDGCDFRIVERAYQTLVARGNFIPNPTVAIQRSVFMAEGMAREDLFTSEDYDLSCRISLNHPIAGARRRFTWYRQGNYDHLSNSSRTYYGHTRVLYENLRDHADKLTPQEYDAALLRFRQGVGALLRHEWAFNGRSAMRARIAEFRPLLSTGCISFWSVASFSPPVIGRSARRILHRMRGISDRKW